MRQKVKVMMQNGEVNESDQTKEQVMLLAKA